MQLIKYKHIATLGDMVNDNPNEDEAELAWQGISHYVRCGIEKVLPGSKDIVLTVAGWKKIVIDLTYKGHVYCLVVLPSLIENFVLKVIGPNRGNNKAEIEKPIRAWLESEVNNNVENN